MNKITTIKPNKEPLMTMSNDFVNARYALGLTETRLFLLALSQISPQDEELQTYKIYIDDFLKSVGASGKAYENINKMKPITKKIISKVIEITQKDGRPWQFSLIISAQYKKDIKGAFVELMFNPVIKPDLIKLKEKFLSCNLNYILPCKSVYSVRLYQLLKQYQYKGERTESVENLKYMFEIEKEYERYSNFKKKVILQSQKELKEKTDISFDFEELKTGKTITHIKFIISRQTPPNSAQVPAVKEQQQPKHPLTEKPETATARLIGAGYTAEQIKEIRAAHDNDFIIENLNIAESKKASGAIKGSIAQYWKGQILDLRQHQTEQQKQEQTAAEAKAKESAARQEAETTGKNIHLQCLAEYTQSIFDSEQNKKIIAGYKKYIKTGVGAALAARNQLTAQTAYIEQVTDKAALAAELSKIAAGKGYILAYNEQTATWEAAPDPQETLF